MIRKILLSGLGLSAALIIYGTASAAILGSPHEIGNGPNLCVACHTPHNANANAKPLWNHTASSAAYTMYDNAFSSTLDMAVAGNTPTGISAACLSCHDGTVGVSSYGGVVANDVLDGGKSVGTDLTDDHPINIAYDPAADPDFVAATGVTGAGLKLYNGQVECATCHDVHNGPGVTGKLERPITTADLCTACHIK
ncbi:MAG: cytochrome C [Gammaproteobacteria bacterium]|nr:cytochrome C [Gammaproteobacteria bacterium]